MFSENQVLGDRLMSVTICLGANSGLIFSTDKCNTDTHSLQGTYTENGNRRARSVLRSAAELISRKKGSEDRCFGIVFIYSMRA